MLTFIDAHIHFHPCFPAEVFFDSARNNFCSIARQHLETSFQCVLCFTESHGMSVYGELSRKAINQEKIGDWGIHTTAEQNTLMLQDNAGFEIIVVAGRQIVTRDKVEVLAVGLNEDIDDGEPIDAVIAYAVRAHAIPILPWGPGKWLGKRKKIVQGLVNAGKYACYLGDNGNRPWLWRKSEIFNNGADHHSFNLPGSDPLPFANEAVKPGSFGFCIEGALDREKPFTSLYGHIVNSSQQFETYGTLESTANFFKNQFAMQLVKRSRKSSKK